MYADPLLSVTTYPLMPIRIKANRYIRDISVMSKGSRIYRCICVFPRTDLIFLLDFHPRGNGWKLNVSLFIKCSCVNYFLLMSSLSYMVKPSNFIVMS